MDEVKITYTLEMRHPGDLRPKTVARPSLRIEHMAIPCPEYIKFLHAVVGHPYRWGGRQGWGKAEWTAYAARDELETWVAYVEGTPAGYFEMVKSPSGEVEIVCFGLLPAFVGQGLGGHLLTVAVERAWAPTADGGMGATRVWLHTCTHDHPHALQNYLSRGFQLERTERGPPNPPLEPFWTLVSGSRQTPRGDPKGLV